MKIKNTFKYHFILGVIIVLMEVFSNYVYMGSEKFLDNLRPGRILLKITFFITFFSVYTINYKVICPKTLPKKNLITFFVAIFLMLFLFAGIRYTLDEIIVYNIFGFHNYYEDKRVFGYYVFDNSYYAIQALLFSTLMYLFFMYVKNKDKAHTMEIEQKTSIFENQLRLLLSDVKDETLEQNIISQFNKKLIIKVGKEASLVPIDTIKYISASGSYVDVKTIDKSYVLRTSLDGVLKDINDKKFVRIHRSTIVNIDYIDKLIYSNHGEIDTKMKDGTLFRVSNSYKKEYLKLIGA
ncbi:LytTR family DNA-binding domain-containing protein [Aquimarina sp. 2201CG5-10]|uniref:LytR/AlgR family response regulator transcription factor n=1 Tax=Aquimarina callyspongiae TaxID=3098150 RepID=UPI002AB47826|nr:LytTR family DNA-binding domain-containing protein [Aquimarina sp. 2201CG5-10]MDY8134538.1 LytTR family DNA-binding domain-containing protein [Aquimarina sp. 2201CG5-10]